MSSWDQSRLVSRGVKRERREEKPPRSGSRPRIEQAPGRGDLRPEADEHAAHGVPDVAGLAPIAAASIDENGLARSSLLLESPLPDDLHAGDGGHAPREMLKETGVPVLHDDEKLNAGKGERRELGKNRRQVSWTESVRLTRIIERLALPEVAWSALGFAPCADRPHRRCQPHRSGSPETKGLSTIGQVSPFGATTQGFTALSFGAAARG